MWLLHISSTRDVCHTRAEQSKIFLIDTYRSLQFFRFVWNAWNVCRRWSRRWDTTLCKNSLACLWMNDAWYRLCIFSKLLHPCLCFFHLSTENQSHSTHYFLNWEKWWSLSVDSSCSPPFVVIFWFGDAQLCWSFNSTSYEKVVCFHIHFFGQGLTHRQCKFLSQKTFFFLLCLPRKSLVRQGTCSFSSGCSHKALSDRADAKAHWPGEQSCQTPQWCVKPDRKVSASNANGTAMPGRPDYASEPTPTAQGDTSNDCERKKLPLKNLRA